MELLQMISPYVEVAIAANSLIIFILLIVSISLWSKNKKLVKKMNILDRGLEDGSMTAFLEKYVDKVDNLEDAIRELNKSTKALRELQRRNIQKVAMEKFNAFKDVGGNLSYAVALLDETNSGVVLSCIFGRDESRHYVKLIENGTCQQHMSQEEKIALDKAQKI